MRFGPGAEKNSSSDATARADLAPRDQPFDRLQTKFRCFRRPKRNGGRHCCQPPLRRAKDLPVFVTWLIEPFGLPTRSRSWLTSSGVAFHLAAPSCEEPGWSTRLRGPRARWSFDWPGLLKPQSEDW